MIQGPLHVIPSPYPPNPERLGVFLQYVAEVLWKMDHPEDQAIDLAQPIQPAPVRRAMKQSSPTTPELEKRLADLAREYSAIERELEERQRIQV